MKKYCKFTADFFIALMLAFIVLSASINFTLIFKPLYYFDLSYLKIEKLSGLSKEDILKNYNYTINYVIDRNNSTYTLPTLTSSIEAQIHFYEVKQLFVKMTLILILSLIIVFAYKFFIKFRPRIYLWSSLLLLFTSIGIIIPSIINFDGFFTLFHKIFFNNSYWQFDPVKDPIITMLPEDFFMHCAILIILLWLTGALIFSILYKKASKTKVQAN